MVNQRFAGIIGMGSAVPDKVLSNLDIEKIVDTSDEWIKTMTGISERRMAEENECTSDFAIKAANMALKRAGIKPTELGMIIVATVTPDMQFPSTACIVQDAIGAVGIPAFDLHAGCSGWVYSLACANAYITSGMCDKVLVIGADLLTKVTNWTDRSTCIVFGDGAGAAVVSLVEEGYGFKAFDLGSDGSGAGLLKIPAGGSKNPITPEAIEKNEHKIYMEGKEVFRFAVTVQGEAIERVLEKSNIHPDEIDLVVPHQANLRIIDAAVKRFDLPREKFFVNIDKYGNTSAASIPIALDEAVQKGKISKGGNLIIVGFGAGLTWGAGAMRWAY